METTGLISKMIFNLILGIKANAGALLAAFTHEIALRKLLKTSRSWKDSLGSVILALAMGYGWRLLAIAYFDWTKVPVKEDVVTAVWVLGTFGGFPVVVWIASHIETIITNKEKKQEKTAVKSTLQKFLNRDKRK